VHAILCRQRFLQRSMALSFGHTGPLLPATPAGPCDAAAGRPAPAPSQAATRSKASKLVGGFVQPAARGALLRPAAAYLCKPLEAVGVCAQAERVPAKVARQRAVQVRGRVGAPAARVPHAQGWRHAPRTVHDARRRRATSPQHRDKRSRRRQCVRQALAGCWPAAGAWPGQHWACSGTWSEG
jgi:hypothetical protein